MNNWLVHLQSMWIRTNDSDLLKLQELLECCERLEERQKRLEQVGLVSSFLSMHQIYAELPNFCTGEYDVILKHMRGNWDIICKLYDYPCDFSRFSRCAEVAPSEGAPQGLGCFNFTTQEVAPSVEVGNGWCLFFNGWCFHFLSAPFEVNFVERYQDVKIQEVGESRHVISLRRKRLVEFQVIQPTSIVPTTR